MIYPKGQGGDLYLDLYPILIYPDSKLSDLPKGAGGGFIPYPHTLIPNLDSKLSDLPKGAGAGDLYLDLYPILIPYHSKLSASTYG